MVHENKQISKEVEIASAIGINENKAIWAEY